VSSECRAERRLNVLSGHPRWPKIIRPPVRPRVLCAEDFSAASRWYLPDYVARGIQLVRKSVRGTAWFQASCALRGVEARPLAHRVTLLAQRAATEGEAECRLSEHESSTRCGMRPFNHAAT